MLQLAFPSVFQSPAIVENAEICFQAKGRSEIRSKKAEAAERTDSGEMPATRGLHFLKMDRFSGGTPTVFDGRGLYKSHGHFEPRPSLELWDVPPQLNRSLSHCSTGVDDKLSRNRNDVRLESAPGWSAFSGISSVYKLEIPWLTNRRFALTCSYHWDDAGSTF